MRSSSVICSIREGIEHSRGVDIERNPTNIFNDRAKEIARENIFVQFSRACGLSAVAVLLLLQLPLLFRPLPFLELFSLSTQKFILMYSFRS